MMRTFSQPLLKSISIALCATLLGPLSWAQDQPLAPVKPSGSILVRPYKPAFIPPLPTSNSGRFTPLIRGGKLYLTVQDAIALALENNIDIEAARYNPLVDQWNLERDEGGGSLPGVPSGQTFTSSVASGQGVSGSQAAAGVSTSGSSQTNNNALGATISQIGPVTPPLDPVAQYQVGFQHRSLLSSDEVVAGLYNVVDNSRVYSATLSEGVITGGQVSLNYRESYLNENSPLDTPNPTYAPQISFTLQHNLLQGFGTAVNSRFITAAKATLKADDLNFKGEVISVIANVITLYYGLAADYQDARAKETALQVAQQFYENNQKEVQLGAMAPLDVTTAEAQVASSQQDLVVSQTNLEQQQVDLKNALSRNGLEDREIANVEIIPLDHIVVPEQDNLPPLKNLILTALQNRTDIAAQKITLSNAEISALGTKNALLPQLVALVTARAQGIAGPYKLGMVPNALPVSNSSGSTTSTTPVSTSSSSGASAASGTSVSLPAGAVACPSGTAPGTLCFPPIGNYVGGINNALSQVFKLDFPNEQGGAYFQAPLRNRVAQADYGIDQLTLRQTALQNQQSLNQLVVDVSNGIVGVQQARVRYLSAVKSRVLEQQLLDAEQKKFSLGASTTFLVVQQQRDLATAQSAEIAALVAYSNARVALDQTLGTTLETNHVSIQEAVSGRVARPSSLPGTLPSEPAPATQQ